MKEAHVHIHRDLPPTRIWGYDGQFPGPTFHANTGEPVCVLWKNKLPPTHFLPIDFTVHGAEKSQPEVRTVVHLHGGVTEDWSDGYPEAWFTRDFKQVGSYFSQPTYMYPNIQKATNLWYHDHAMGITRLNIYAGLFGMYIIHDDEERSHLLPTGYYDIPLILCDRSFHEDGSLYYPSQSEKPVKDVNPSVIPDFFGDTIVVNGKAWPYLQVEPRRYRFRVLNGSNARFYKMSLSNGHSFIIIGTDQGLVRTPIETSSILLAPAERVDVIIDFSSYEGESIILLNDAAAPFPQGGQPDRKTTGTIMQFRVGTTPTIGYKEPLPYILTTIPMLNEQEASCRRNLTLSMRPDQYGRNIHLLDDRLWTEPISEKACLGSIEVWTLINLSKATHPIHLHLVQFQILDRQPFDREVYEKDGTITRTGPRRGPERIEQGWKDTVRANPGEVTRIIMQFGPFTGLYVWHCHILEHEDYEMMRPYVVVIQ